MLPSYDNLRRLLVGTKADGLPVTMRCFIDDDGSAIVAKFYNGRFATPYGPELVYRIHDSLQPAGESIEEQATAMRCAWLKKFVFVGQDAQAELAFDDETKRMRLAYTCHGKEIWMSWFLRKKDGELTYAATYWSSPTSKELSDKPKAIEDGIDLNTLVREIQLRGLYDWKSAALNMLATRYNIEEPPAPLAEDKDVTITGSKRALSGVNGHQRGTAKKPRMKEEQLGEESQSSMGTPTPNGSVLSR
ncbi:hypothetical protein K504DRAFT_521563 [Pleomassaria siparia CBS 279.74]|uniref:Uncharacterized protein n=1 Tax=Pleomassaria siparia CBS 279.74 TaxID=1314801 RepID=A0A6G1KI30_9PLEO|nr:hypothetical protein K504DRAFT_521563 [Pleomassaria siparia CBS 279.74]